MAVGATTDSVVILRQHILLLSESVQETSSTGSLKSRGQTRDHCDPKFTVDIRRNQKAVLSDPGQSKPEETSRDEVDAVDQYMINIIIRPLKENSKPKEEFHAPARITGSDKNVSQGDMQPLPADGYLPLSVASQNPPSLNNVKSEKEICLHNAYFPEDSMFKTGHGFHGTADITACRGYKLHCLIIFLLLASNAHCQTYVSTNQILMQECIKHTSYTACLKPDIKNGRWEKMNRICCSDLTKKMNIAHFWSCQEGMLPSGIGYIIHACMKNQTVPAGKTLNLTVNSVDNTPEYIEQDCQKGFYEDKSRNSYMILEPKCTKPQQDCSSSSGKMLEKQGSPSSDNICKCLPNAKYEGDKMAVCAQGFSGDSVCYCQFCDEGLQRNENNICVQVGQTTLPYSSSDFGAQNTTQTRPHPTILTSIPHAKHTGFEWWIMVAVIGGLILLAVVIIIIIVYCSGDKRYFPASQKEDQQDGP